MTSRPSSQKLHKRPRMLDIARTSVESSERTNRTVVRYANNSEGHWVMASPVVNVDRAGTAARPKNQG
jgi:hypothetical protein